ncbi:MAG: NADH:ubiquinone reductase (Na(+)-transporting) subunit C [Gammaproteobacteria bacterium]|nr:NADH:ubiquinone reductase (Na(+)-transporting) subunit C [Gammaproteobacteria bacterium]
MRQCARTSPSIGRRARYSIIYLLEDGEELDKVVIPVHGYGLWSTMYGFLALEEDMNTVAGITFYEQQETAGLGGEVDNPDWKAGWEGKEIYKGGEVALEVIKGSVDPERTKTPNTRSMGLSGATLTSRGVRNLVALLAGRRRVRPDAWKQLETENASERL